MFWIKWWLKKCEKPKKLKVLFGFLLRSQKETKATNTQKKLEFFVFHTSLTIILSKTQKNLEFFSFFKVKTKKKQKNLGKTKKTKHEPQTKHSLKSFGFLVFWFSRGFLILSMFFVFLGFPHGFSPKESSNIVFCFQLVLIVCTATTHKTSLKNNWLFYIYAHKYIIYTYIHVETIYQNALR